jgi:hypothetical protein
MSFDENKPHVQGQSQGLNPSSAATASYNSQGRVDNEVNFQ